MRIVYTQGNLNRRFHFEILNSIYFQVFICIGMLLKSAIVMGQKAASDEMYVKYNEYFSEALRNGFQSGNTGKYKTIKELQDGAALLIDDQVLAEEVLTLKGNSRALDEKDIFSKRRKSVFVVGQLYLSTPQSRNGLNFNLTGTAFAITADGICVTNYHVLKNVIRGSGVAKIDSLYFIITTDKKVYFIDSILAFSQNNDLAIFKVSTHADKLNPIPLGKPANTGAAVYCISHPLGHFYYFSKGIVARNVAIDTLEVTEGYDKNGKPPIRMEITADYGVGSSGGPILDKFGNLIGIVISTTPIIVTEKDKEGKDFSYIQMTVKDTSPVKALSYLLRN
jgi:serine protease Do